MILSNGKNKFQNNEFSFWEWSAPILQTHEEVVAGFIDEETLNHQDDFSFDD